MHCIFDPLMRSPGHLGDESDFHVSSIERSLLPDGRCLLLWAFAVRNSGRCAWAYAENMNFKEVCE